MKRFLLKPVVAFIFVMLGSMLAFGQVSSAGSLAGTVTDPSGASVAGATIVVKNNANNTETTATSSDNGSYAVPALPTGIYTVTITAQGFKQAVVQDVKVDVGAASSINVALEVGAVTETVTITGAGGELLQTQSATIGTTITGRQITDLPYASRNALDIVLLLPGASTPGRPRTSTVNGLPKGSLNITLDGINVQDNLLKSSDGFFTYIQPKTDAIEEVTLSTANPGAESAGEGAVQIKFATRSGTNDFHGSAYIYHRNPAFNANYYFNNRDLPADPVDGKAPRARVLLTQPGIRIGGPIIVPKLFNGRDRAFFFFNYEEYRLPERTLRQRTIVSPLAQAGVFQYTTSSGATQQVNLLQLAAANSQTSTIDPTVGALLAQIRSSTSQGGVETLSDPNLQRFSFINPGGQKRYFPTSRFDFVLSSKHRLENVYNYQKFDSQVDFLNGTDPSFPGFPNFGSQKSNRFSNSTALRSTLTQNIVNEARFGLTGGTVLFFPEIGPAQFDNQGGFNLGLSAFNGIRNATTDFGNGVQRRNTPVKQFTDTLTYVRGSHSFNFGGSYTQINLFSSFQNQIVPNITFGLAAQDPASAFFTAGNFPGASAAQIGQAQSLYAVLTGRVTAVNRGAVRSEEDNGNFVLNGTATQRARQREMGFFAQDAWRVRPNLTLTYGLRYELQFPPTAQNDTGFTTTTRAGLFGVSGENNLFRPGVLTGAPTTFTPLMKGDRAHNLDRNNFAPSFGFAYQPDFKSGLLNSVLGDAGQTVFRGGASIAYVREGMSFITTVQGTNPGGTVSANRSVVLGNLPAGTLFRDRAALAGPVIPQSPTFPITGSQTDQTAAFDPNLRTGYVGSFSFGVQREITKDMVFEARYVGNRGIKIQRLYFLNEVNVVENGFINEFRLAQANLQANLAAGRGATFRYFGAGTGTSPLPITFSFFTGRPGSDAGNAALYTSTLFANAAFVNPLAVNNPLPQTFAATLNTNFLASAAAGGLPRNIFVVNPDKLGGNFIVDNGLRTSYDSLQLELRRRLSAGTLVQASYVFSKSLANAYASSSFNQSNYVTLRNPSLNKTRSPFDITQAFKANFIQELPFGQGRRFGRDVGGLLNALIGGFDINGTVRVQSGTPFNFGNVQLVGLTRDELQKEIKIIKDPNRISFFLPPDIILNTRRAFNASATAANGFSALGVPEGRYIAPASTANCVQSFGGQCGISNLVLEGPRFVRADISLLKRIKFTENTNLELRAEALNVFNNINFRVNNAASDASFIGASGTFGAFNSATFGQTTFAYQDLSTTNDPGGRLIQLVARFNF